MAITDKFDIARKRDQSVATWDKLKTDFSNHPGSHGALIVTSLVLIALLKMEDSNGITP